MIPEVKKMIFDRLSPEQIAEILKEMEVLAQQKHSNMVNYYFCHKDVADEVSPDLQETVESSDWRSFLPNDYHTLKALQDEQKRKVS